MVMISIIAFSIIFLFVLMVGGVFFFPVLELSINAILLYIVLIRSYIEVYKEEKHYFYLGGLVISMFVYVISGNFLEKYLVWNFTTFLVLAFILTQLGFLIKYLEDKYAKHEEYKQKKTHLHEKILKVLKK